MATLTVTVLHTKGVKGGDLAGEADPYVKVKYGGQSFKTRVEKDVGADAEFHETFVFQMKGPPHTIDVEVYDKNLIIDQLLAKGQVTFDVEGVERVFKDYPLYAKNKNQNGEVSLAYKYTPKP